MSLGGLLRGGNGGDSGSRSLTKNNRAQSVVIGTILVFGLIVLAYGIFQATVIPSANEDVEVEHSQQVRGEMQDIRNNVLQSASSGRDTRQTVKIGVEYPNRLLFINPGPTAGSLQTEGTSDSQVAIALENVEATDDETADYLNGDKRVFSTGAIVYRQDYNIFQSGPDSVAVDNSLAYSNFSDGQFVSTGQQIISGKEISLIALDGELSRSEVSQYTVDTEAVSAPSTTVPVTNDSEAINITISTRLSEETLIQDVFRSQIDDNGNPPAEPDDGCDDISPDNSSTNDRYINNCAFDDSAPGEFNNFTLILEPDNTYTLELAKVGVGTQISEPEPTYLVATEGREADVALNGRLRLGFQVRDQFNNGIGDQTIDVRIKDGFGSLIYKGENRSDEAIVEVEPDGSVKGLYYQAPPSSSTTPRTVDIQAKFNSTTYPSPNGTKNVSFSIEVINASRIDRTTPLFNPGSGVVIEGAELIGNDGGETQCGSPPNKQTCEVLVTFNNTESQDATVTAVRYPFYSDDTNSKSGIDEFGLVEITPPTGSAKGYEALDTFQPAPGPGDSFDFNASSTTTLSFKFKKQDGDVNTAEPVSVGDWFVIELEINGQSQTYFVVIGN